MDMPEQFRDPATGGVDVEALMRAYLALEQRMTRMVPLPDDTAGDDERHAFHRAIGVPAAPEEYQVRFQDARFAADPEVNRRLHAAGLTPGQVQLVYDLAVEHLGPAVERVGAEFEARRGGERLAERFGGADKWREVSRQLKAWGEANLAPDVLHALACTEEGVCALHAMMQKGEPGFGTGSGAQPPAGEAELTRMMRDPRYWKSRDPDFIAQVSEGFRRLYPG
jgi:hypothetical protein